ncbi:hypothetical protein [Halosolutus gelatinilyticus]|uniref:hypothetical protein n=1 Tax=Halosolutus gelatinilyticus TaxID=2931975 RepID=UPI001FF1CE4C|nr:hypothetical protein [Halosolutus gelatinilyticus]
MPLAFAYRRIEDWFDDRPFAHVLAVAAAVGMSWACSSAVIGDEPFSAAAKYGLVAGISGFVAAGIVVLARR